MTFDLLPHTVQFVRAGACTKHSQEDEFSAKDAALVKCVLERSDCPEGTKFWSSYELMQPKLSAVPDSARVCAQAE